MADNETGKEEIQQSSEGTRRQSSERAVDRPTVLKGQINWLSTIHIWPLGQLYSLFPPLANLYVTLLKEVTAEMLVLWVASVGSSPCICPLSLAI